MSREVVIVGAARTAVGAFNGAFAAIPAHQLGAAAISAALQRAKLDPSEVDEVILGQVLGAGEGQNPGAPGGDEGRRAEREDGVRA